MKRQPRVRERIIAKWCEDCIFRVCQGCKVPGGTCAYRKVESIPGHYVGDILQNAGLITDEWLEDLK